MSARGAGRLACFAAFAAFAKSLCSSVHRAGSSPRRASNFLLLRQKKVTKEEALNRKSPLACEGHRAKTNARSLSRSEPLRSRCCPYPEPDAATACAVNVGCTPNSRVEVKRRRRRVQACGAFIGKPGVQPALTGVKVRWMALVTGTAARAQRVASSHTLSTSFRARAFPGTHWCAVQRLSFGDFSLARQRKVTRPPGRTPGTVHRVERLQAKASLIPSQRIRTRGKKNGAAAPFSNQRLKPDHHTVIGSVATIALPALHENACAK
jgi:hypothetical protein